MTSKDFITKTMAEATTMFEVFDKIVAKMDADAAKIAELEAKLAQYDPRNAYPPEASE